MANRWLQRALERLPLRWLFEVFYMASADPWRYWRSDFEKRRYDAAISLLERHAPAHARVLEIGCSVGAFTGRLMLLRPQQVTAVDISSMALRRVRAALPRDVEEGRLVLACADVFREPPPGGPYDVVVAMDVLGYTDDPSVLAATRDRLRHCLAPQGLVLVGNTKLRAHDGEGFEPFASGFPKQGAGALLACVGESMDRLDGIDDKHWRLDVLRLPQTARATAPSGSVSPVHPA